MSKTIGGIYRKGKIIVPELPDVKDDTNVIVTFLEPSLNIETKVAGSYHDPRQKILIL